MSDPMDSQLRLAPKPSGHFLEGKMEEQRKEQIKKDFLEALESGFTWADALEYAKAPSVVIMYLRAHDMYFNNRVYDIINNVEK